MAILRPSASFQPAGPTGPAGSPGPAPRRGRIRVIVGLLLFGALLFAGISEIATREAGEAEPIELDGGRDAQRVFGGLRQHEERIGSPDAPVTIQLFTDMQCGACADHFLETAPVLVEELVRTGRAQVLYRHYSFSRSAIQRGFLAAEAAGEQGYLWQYAYIFFASQEELERVGLDREALRDVAASIPELEVEAWQEDLDAAGEQDGPVIERLLAEDEIARELGLRAEPSAIVSGPAGTETLQDSPAAGEILAAVDDVSP